MAPDTTTIETAFKKYAKAYEELDKLQGLSKLLPGGDQKTGVVGEYYAALFALGTHPTAKVTIAPNSQKNWDIEVVEDGKLITIQVKTISAFSKTGKISTIKKEGWHFLYIIHVNHEFDLDGFWVVKYPEINLEGDLKEIYGPRPGRDKLSGKINFGPNRISELLDGVAKGRKLLATSKAPNIEQLSEMKPLPGKKARVSKKK